MRRHSFHAIPAMMPSSRPVLLQPKTWLVFITVWALAVNSWLGPAFIGLSLFLWAAYCLQNGSFAARSLGALGVVPWLLPLLALMSAFWSPVPELTARAAIQFGVTVALALMTARLVPPRRFIVTFWAVMAIILIFSIFINKPHYDGMTGRTTMSGVFGNKNLLSLCCGIFALSSAAIALDRNFAAVFRMIGFLGIIFGLTMSVLARSVGFTAAMMIGLAALVMISTVQLLPVYLRKTYVKLATLAGVATGAIGLVFVVSFAEDFLALVGKDSTLTGRTVLWFYADRLSQDYLPLGIGFHAFWQQGFAPAEQLWKMMHIASRRGFHFHSLYYEVLVQIGYLGVFLCLINIIYCVAKSFRFLYKSPGVVSVFFFSFILMLLFTQGQEVGIFSQFDLYCYCFFSSMAYVVNWSRDGGKLEQVRAWPFRFPAHGIQNRTI